MNRNKTFVALGVVVFGSGYAAIANAQTALNPVVTFTNSIQGAIDAQSTNKINLMIGGTVVIKGTVRPDAMGVSLVDGKQLLEGNVVELLKPAPDEWGNTTTIWQNDAELGSNSFAGASGNIGINVAAGDNMTQDNGVAINTVRSWNQGMKADVIKLQRALDNLFNPTQNVDAEVVFNANIANGAFDNAAGSIGANVAAGAHIAQQNSLAVAVAAGGPEDINLSSTNVGVVQIASGNHSWLWKVPHKASVGDIGNGAAGNIGINVAAGTNLLQNNALAVSAVGQ